MSIAAIDMVQLIREYEEVAKLDKAPLFVPHSIMTAAVTHLLNATSTQPTIKSQSIRHFRVCFDALISMQKRWVKAKNFVSYLQELAQRWAIIQALPLHRFPQTSSFNIEKSVEKPVEKPIENSHEFVPNAFSGEPQESSTFGLAFESLPWADVDTMNLASYQAEPMDLHMCYEFEPFAFMTPDHDKYHRS